MKLNFNYKNKQRLNFSNSLILSFAIIILVSGCLDNGTTTQQRKYLENLQSTSLTNAEVSYLNSLERKGYKDINVHVPISGYKCQGCSSYILKMKAPFSLTKDNKDSIIALSNDIALDLYSSVIEDSIIIELGMIRIEFSVLKSEIESWHYILVREHKKKDLAKAANFKVMEIDKGVFIRKKIN